MAESRDYKTHPIECEFMGGPKDGCRELLHVRPPSQMQLDTRSAQGVQGQRGLAIYDLAYRPVYIFKGYRTEP